MVTDFALLERWRNGDADAGNELFERHFESVYRFFAHKVDAEAADLVQRTFLGCLESLGRFRGEASFRTFLFSIARNELFGHFRQRRRRPDEEVGASSLCELAPSPSTLLGEKGERRLLLEALRSIPLELQMLLELHYWEQLTGPELARVLDVPEGTVRSRLQRARELLGRRLEELATSPEHLTSTVQDLDGWADALKRMWADAASR